MSDRSEFDAQFMPPVELQEAWTRIPAIVKLGHPVLRQVAPAVTRVSGETRRLIEHMTVTMRQARGLGLAAPQVGVSTRILIYDAGDGLKVLINPKILGMKGKQLDPPEGCLSIPGLTGQVERGQELRVKGFDERLRPVSIRATGMEARVIQHEIDHLDGILFIDKADPETLEWSIDGDDEDEEEELKPARKRSRRKTQEPSEPSEPAEPSDKETAER
ncbi:MAG: peptide deformylase [Chthonomonadales bacterium]|nr:peptide deformylase [Chthonomonadales bacterium]